MVMNTVSETPEISIIIPVYHTDDAMLKRALKSTQTITQSHEIIIIFDGEQRQSLQDIVSEYARNHRVRAITIDHAGPAGARNRGIQEAQGTWITFLDADDEIIGAHFGELITVGQREQCQIVQGSYEKRMKDAVEHCALAQETQIYSGSSGIEQFLCTLFQIDCGTSTIWSKIYRRSFLVQEHIQFDPAMTIEDTTFMFDAVSHAQTVGFVPVDVYAYCRNGESWVTTFREQYAQRITQSLVMLQERVRAYGSERIMRAFDEAIVFHALLIMVHFIFNRNNPWPERKKKQYFQQFLRDPMYKQAIASVPLQHFSLSKRVSIVVLRLHLYYAMKMICQVRNHQLR